MLNILTSQFGLDKSDLVSSLPFILEEIRSYTNQYFLTTTNIRVEKIEDNKIYYNHKYGDFVIGDVIEIYNSLNNYSLYFVKEVTNSYITVETELINELDNKSMIGIKLSFRGVNGRTVKAMFDYDTDNEGMGGIQSESLGGYSVTYRNNTIGNGALATTYPSDMYGSLNALRKIDDGGLQYARYGYAKLQ